MLLFAHSFFRKGDFVPLTTPSKNASLLTFLKFEKSRGARGEQSSPLAGRKKIAHGITRIKAIAFLREMQKLGFIDRLKGLPVFRKPFSQYLFSI